MAMAAGMIYAHWLKSNSTEPPQEGDLRVWWIPQIGAVKQVFFVPVKDPEQAILVLGLLAAYDDYQFANNVKSDYANTGGLSVFDDGDWYEWEDRDGDEIDQYRHKQGKHS